MKNNKVEGIDRVIFLIQNYNKCAYGPIIFFIGCYFSNYQLEYYVTYLSFVSPESFEFLCSYLKGSAQIRLHKAYFALRFLVVFCQWEVSTEDQSLREE